MPARVELGASRVKRRLPLLIAGGAALALVTRNPLPASLPAAAVVLQDGTRGWTTVRTAPSGCETPFRSIVSDGDTTTLAALLGDTRTTPEPGCDPTWILNVFDCGAGESAGGYCTVTFDATLWLAAGERAVVLMTADTNMAAYELPGARAGKSGRYAAAVAGGGRVRLVFAVWNSPAERAGTRSLLIIEQVESYRTAKDITSVSLTPVRWDEVPIDHESIGGHRLQSSAGPEDCNENGLPDAYEVSQGVAPDRDGDGRPDACQEQRRQIDWVLLAIGVLIFAVVLIRLAVNHRTRYV
jgi:hypothetical protein